MKKSSDKRTLLTAYCVPGFRARDLDCGGREVWLDFEMRRVYCKACGGVKRERLDFLSPNAKFTEKNISN